MRPPRYVEMIIQDVGDIVSQTPLPHKPLLSRLRFGLSMWYGAKYIQKLEGLEDIYDNTFEAQFGQSSSSLHAHEMAMRITTRYAVKQLEHMQNDPNDPVLGYEWRQRQDDE